MNVLVIGGTGVIGAGVVKHLLLRGAKVTVFARGRREDSLPPSVTRLVGDRSDAASFERRFEASRYDAVIDLLCFTPLEAESAIRAFGGRCEHFEFCSTVCTYGPGMPASVLVDETFPQEPITEYGRNKVLCERSFERAAENGRFELTIVRPSHTYGPGGPVLDQLEIDGAAWDRVAHGLLVLCAGDGLGLWQATHRDDCGKLFAYGALNPRTYGQAYNATRDQVFTWRDYYRQGARALGTRAELVFAPADWLLRELPHRFDFLREVSRFHGAYTSAKATAHVPDFTATVDFETGARETFADIRRRGVWRNSAADAEYEDLVGKALNLGFGVAIA